MSENYDELSAVISERFKTELDKNNFRAKSLSRDIGAHENTLGNYVRNKVPDQWVYLAKLHEQGIPTAVHYPIPLNQQYAVADSDAKLPVGDTVAQKVVSLPMHPYLDEASILRIVQTINCA